MYIDHAWFRRHTAVNARCCSSQPLTTCYHSLYAICSLLYDVLSYIALHSFH